jgi:hypothetical protein
MAGPRKRVRIMCTKDTSSENPAENPGVKPSKFDYCTHLQKSYYSIQKD